MDILGSIMKNMVKPPQLGEKERAARKKQQELVMKMREEERKAAEKFRTDVKEKIQDFLETGSGSPEDRLTFDPMNKVQRSVVHDIAETANLVAHSFGEEDVDRHVVIFRQEAVPCDEELSAMRHGATYLPPCPSTSTSTNSSEKDESAPKRTAQRKGKNNSSEVKGPIYLQKYEKHFGGLEVAMDAARTTEANKSYGCVSTELKKDKRTIEETLADIRAKKKQKLNANLDGTGSKPAAP